MQQQGVGEGSNVVLASLVIVSDVGIAVDSKAVVCPRAAVLCS